MNGSFNGQILVDKLAKLNNSQQSIETLSHWCIFHRNKAKQVVETWERQFHNSPPDRRVSFLYLANDILQNSRRKGMEFITEFWRVLPDALNDVLENGDEFGRNAVIRLVGIWEERKVFGSRGQTLKEELLGRKLENRNRDGKGISYKLKPGRQLLEKLISSYEHIQSAPMDDDALFGKCQNAINFVDKMEKEYGNKSNLGNNSESGVLGDFQVQHSRLRECIEQLKAAEFSRKTLVSQLREVLHEEELKIEQVHNQLQVAQSRYEQADVLFRKQLSYNIRQPPSDQNKDSSSSLSDAPLNLKSESTAATGEKSQISPIVYNPEGTFNHNDSSRVEEEASKMAAASMAAKLTASTTSAEMLSYVFSSLASDGIINQRMKEEYPDNNKRPKLENSVPSYVPPPYPQPQSQPPPPPFPHPDSLQQPPPPSPSMDHPNPSLQPPPPPPTSLPLMPPLLPPTSAQYMPTAAGAMTGMPYGYVPAPFPLPNFPMVGMPPFPGAPNPYQSFPVSEGALFSQPPFPVPPPPMTKQ
ncbi:uncharacterized protein [Typha latifolia]|uniref:uncharacterized protein isoform X1 n=2 Tax=Typha latifolia TaxID=4733 RepID=UPI003C2FD67A